MSLKITMAVLAFLLLPGCTAPDSDRIASSAGVATAVTTADPAVVFANANRSGPQAYSEGYFGSGDQRLHYVEAGEGPLIIFYHGFPSFWYSWFDQMEALKDRYRVVAVDALGSGLSAKPQTIAPYTIENLSAQLDAFSRHLGGDEKYILVGHDWGSVLALSYAQAYPDRLHKVVGMSAPPLNLFLGFTAGSAEQQRRTQYMQVIRSTTLAQLQASNAGQTVGRRSYQKLAERGDLTPEEVKLFHAALGSAETIYTAMHWYRANVPPFDAITDRDRWPGPDAKITMPGLFIWGEADQIFVPELIAQVDSAGTDMRTVKLPGINHWTSMEQPEQATSAIVAFLEE